MLKFGSISLRRLSTGLVSTVPGVDRFELSVRLHSVTSQSNAGTATVYVCAALLCVICARLM